MFADLNRLTEELPNEPPEDSTSDHANDAPCHFLAFVKGRYAVAQTRNVLQMSGGRMMHAALQRRECTTTTWCTISLEGLEKIGGPNMFGWLKQVVVEWVSCQLLVPVGRKCPKA